MEIVYQHFKTIDSTNTWGKLNCHLFDKKKMTFVTADTQTNGRGRFKRKWLSPSDNIYATFCFSFDLKRQDIGNIPQVLSLSVAHVLHTLNLEPKLKWPNDILLNGKKLGGILCETLSFEDHLMVILGIGLNVNMNVEELKGIDRPATSLKNETETTFVVKDILKMIEKQFLSDFEIFLKGGFAPFLAAYKTLFWVHPGEKIRFHNNIEVVEGLFHSINNDGSLNLIIDGTVQKFISGEFV